MKHKARVYSAGVRYDGHRLWTWHCPQYKGGWNRPCRGNTYGSWAAAIKDAIKHAESEGRSY